VSNGESQVVVSLLDVGPREYGDAMLLQFGEAAVLVDGAHMGRQDGDATHPSIPDQLGRLLHQQGPPYEVDLLIVSHAHQDHVGCLPHLVANDILRSRWALMPHPGAGFGRAAGIGSSTDAIDSPRVRAVVAALREEVPYPRTTDFELMQILDGAATLESRYVGMLRDLEAAGTQVVVPADPTGSEMDALLAEFGGIGLTVLGPSMELLEATAEGIRLAVDGAVDAVVELASRDTRASATDLYRRLLSLSVDALDAESRPGNLVNLQSYVTLFDHAGTRLLLAGDMQFTDPGIGDDRIGEAVRSLRTDLAQHAPYSFVKLSHHGSGNAFDAAVLQEMGATKLYGICAGAHSSHHPDPEVLALLDEHRDDLQWVRSDRNGLTTIEFRDGDASIDPSRGDPNDPTPNEVDAPGGPAPRLASEGVATELAPVQPPGPSSEVVATGAEEVVVTTRVPHLPTNVRVTIEVNPGPRLSRPDDPSSLGGAAVVSDVKVGGGRQLPKLLFATNREALEGNIGGAEATAALDAVERAGHTLVDMPPPSQDPKSALVKMRGALAAEPKVAGVVLLGGYNVVPSTRLDCIPQQLRHNLGATGDPDNFTVWSDDPFGDADGDLLPEYPVTRIPDGRDRDLFRAALAASPRPTAVPRSGIRNVARPFAAPIFAGLSGDDELLVSQPHVFRPDTPAGVDGDRIYLMLHGDWREGGRFWGEDTGGVEAVNVANIPTVLNGAVVFAGCCWGGLTVDLPANEVVFGRPFGQKSPNASMALSFLRRGALAFVGCTGAHYSPVDEPYDYFGGPMHRAFWTTIGAGEPPARALFAAKQEYARNLPHGLTRPIPVAVEYKTLRQFTCLGLGW
jgi:beta-lactamase superfamily II metal-dependent hydrolase